MIAAFFCLTLLGVPEAAPEIPYQATASVAFAAATSSVTYHKFSAIEVARIAKVIDDSQIGWADCKKEKGVCALHLRTAHAETADIRAELARAYDENEELEARLATATRTSTRSEPIVFETGRLASPWVWLGIATGLAFVAGIVVGDQF